jgi:hypothetical protein
MPKAMTRRPSDEMLSNYDFTGGVRGKYFKRAQRMKLKFTVSASVASKLGGQAGLNRVLQAFARKDIAKLTKLMQGQGSRSPRRRATRANTRGRR